MELFSELPRAGVGVCVCTILGHVLNSLISFFKVLSCEVFS